MQIHKNLLRLEVADHYSDLMYFAGLTVELQVCLVAVAETDILGLEDKVALVVDMRVVNCLLQGKRPEQEHNHRLVEEAALNLAVHIEFVDFVIQLVVHTFAAEVEFLVVLMAEDTFLEQVDAVKMLNNWLQALGEDPMLMVVANCHDDNLVSYLADNLALVVHMEAFQDILAAEDMTVLVADSLGSVDAVDIRRDMLEVVVVVIETVKVVSEIDLLIKKNLVAMNIFKRIYTLHCSRRLL